MLRKSSCFYGKDTRCQKKVAADTLKGLALPVLMVFDAAFMVLSPVTQFEFYSRESDTVSREKTVITKWKADCDNLYEEPIKNKKIEVHIPEINFSKTFKSDQNGVIDIDISGYLPEEAKDLKFVCTIGRDKLAPISCTLKQQEVAQLIELYPKYPAVLQVTPPQLKPTYSLFERGDFIFTIANKGKDRAWGIKIEPQRTSWIDTEGALIDFIDPGESRTLAIPYQITGVPENRTDKQYFSVTDSYANKYGNKAQSIALSLSVPIPKDGSPTFSTDHRLK